MPTNIEFKAYCDDLAAARATCDRLGAAHVRSGIQKDSYFRSRSGRLKLRRFSDGSACLVHYLRSDRATQRESLFEIVQLPSGADQMERMLDAAVGTWTTVVKHRTVYEWRGCLINLDSIHELGEFLEVEVQTEKVPNVEAARELAIYLKQQFGITQADILPWSYSDMCVMREASDRWRTVLGASPVKGVMFVIDGASASGKTSLVQRLLQRKDPEFELIPRYSSRPPRPGINEPEYIFVSPQEFAARAAEGEFIEYRNFDFGMSYGLPWREAVTGLQAGGTLLGIINWGNIRHVRSVLPEAVTVLIDAPLQTIHDRLLRRGFNDPAQVAERLSNAAAAEFYRPLYDYIVVNDDGMLEEAEDALALILSRHSGGEAFRNSSISVEPQPQKR